MEREYGHLRPQTVTLRPLTVDKNDPAEPEASAPQSARVTNQRELGSCFGDDVDVLLGQVDNSSHLPALMRSFFTSEEPTPMATAPALIQSAAVVRSTPPVGVSFTCGIGPWMSLKILRAEMIGGEDLHHVGAGAPGGEDFGRRQRARHGDAVVAVGHLDHFEARAPARR